MSLLAPVIFFYAIYILGEAAWASILWLYEISNYIDKRQEEQK